ncbi:MBL fold metallo-hydrolase [Planococcus shenhongbingii]|uniref:MBL fold metallo-hydrolase n=1 Tax=Planococcus shenhongbingii TaxID=3058398 RepID=A0ABT8NFT1_9BACL|nr:MBL fold metallo-hydrolase [Planococcus sp. N017]MDN7246761.1 MBL fold metallo-hydrolase [Planococcus sp. N017]
MKKRFLLIASLVLALVLAGCLQTPTPQEDSAEPPKTAVSEKKPGGLTVHFIDVGQADATLLQFEEFALLIDTGDWNSTAAVDYLKKLGLEKLDIVVGTHPDSDHIGQLEQVVQDFEVGEVWMSGNASTSNTFIDALKAIDETGTDYYEPRSGEVFDVGSLQVEVLYPEEITGKANEESISLKLTYGDVRFVFTGDAGVKEEQAMIDSGADLDAEILHLGHHGSNTSTSTAFLKAVSPEVAVYSAGMDNSYGHPHAEVIAATENAGAEVYGTDINGTIVLETDGKTYDTNTEKEGTAVEGTNRCIDINVASSAELQEIEGIGPALADAIIKERPFEEIEELDEIKGIGKGKINAIKEQDLACVGE